jgi:hypothetical protein
MGETAITEVRAAIPEPAAPTIFTLAQGRGRRGESEVEHDGDDATEDGSESGLSQSDVDD